MRKYLIAFCIFVLFVSCASNSKNYIEPTVKPLEFTDQEKELKIDFNELENLETEPPNFIYLKQKDTYNYMECKEDEEPSHVAMSSEELDKIERLVDLKNTYKKISKEEYEIIKLQERKIEIIKDIAKTEREARIGEEKMKLNYEEAYEKEIKRRSFDNISYKILLFFSLLGNIVASF